MSTTADQEGVKKRKGLEGGLSGLPRQLATRIHPIVLEPSVVNLSLCISSLNMPPSNGYPISCESRCLGLIVDHGAALGWNSCGTVTTVDANFLPPIEFVR